MFFNNRQVDIHGTEILEKKTVPKEKTGKEYVSKGVKGADAPFV